MGEPARDLIPIVQRSVNRFRRAERTLHPGGTPDRQVCAVVERTDGGLEDGPRVGYGATAAHPVVGFLVPVLVPVGGWI
jgi:hypothetical protein